MRQLTTALRDDPEIRRLLKHLDETPAALSGTAEIHRAHIAATISLDRPVCLICTDEDEAARLTAAVSAFLAVPEVPEPPVAMITAREFTFHNAEAVTREFERRRIRGLLALAEGAQITVMTISGALQRTIPPDLLMASTLTLQQGDSCALTFVADHLIKCGYSRVDQVESAGQFAIRGGILDFFSPSHTMPVRCEFFGDEIDAIGVFDPETQRRTENLQAMTISPAAETLPGLHEGGAEQLLRGLQRLVDQLALNKSANPQLLESLRSDISRLSGGSFPAADKYLELIYPFSTALDYLQDDTVIILSDSARVKEAAENYTKLLAEDCVVLLETGVLDSSLVRFSADWDSFAARAERHCLILAESFPKSEYPWPVRMQLNINAKRLPAYGGSLDTALSDIAHYRDAGYRTVVLCADARRAQILWDHLEARGVPSGLDYALTSLPADGECTLTIGGLQDGMEYADLKLAVITEGQLITRAKPARKGRRAKQDTTRQRLQSFSDLSPGDLVVHEQYGIGRFTGFVRLQVDDVWKDYVKIAYAGTDSLYVPATQLDMVAKYIGGGDHEGGKVVKLSKMNGTDWTKAKTRAKGAAREMAQELIQLYSARRQIKGRAFPKDAVWQTEFEERFAYEETDDQLKCIEEIKKDMESPIPMDRLLCGDVGYGKTEVALRAVMKCILGGCQAAILVPTTVLAQQHYVTAVRRFAGYPVNIAVLSRFKSAAEIKKTLREIELGSVDLVIGTHRLIQKDVKFKNLGLLVIDEEQRFGVSHKERLKELAKDVDVLTLSATPIPRTLNMALSGIRDMSTIEEPPQSRRPVQTYVLEHDWGVLTEAIRREISRGGQVYYLHNRIDNILRVAARLQEMLGEDVRLAVAHGRMDEDTLSDVMEHVTSGEVDVLICTTIIESGIDIPNVNTLIVENADHLGLAQLHQIRGRVGRSQRRAYAYFTFRRGKALSEIAEKRLSALREFAEFNSGFKIALRDLEIRGAGSLLGAEQSGHMLSVGYDMYLKLLEEAVLEEKGESPKQTADCPADLHVSAGIPESYISSGSERMDIYRRIATIRTAEDRDDMLDELIDRYGDPPDQVVALTSVALLRGEAAKAGFTEISQKDGHLRLKVADFNMDKISYLYALPQYRGRLRVVSGAEPTIAVKIENPSVIEEALRFIRDYAAAAANHPS
ncbi:MAG: transcription-repair coupling factor [Oscillospiraceae bacterium]|nr:transcription-repair coupling factor [Oscillospiraceae bacterium]